MSRVLFISQNYSTHARRFLAGLAEAGHDVWFLPCAAEERESASVEFPKNVRRLPPLCKKRGLLGIADVLRLYMRLRRVINGVRPELIQAGPVQTGGFLAALSGFHPLLVMSWGSDVLSAPNNSWRMRAITKFTLRRADMVLGDCEAVCKAISTLGSLPRERIISFPWGIDLQLFRPTAPTLGLRERLGWRGCRVIVSARSLEPFHGTMMLLEAMKDVLEQRADARVLMLGEGSLRRQAEAYIAEHGLAGKIQITGQVPEAHLAEYFAEADLYVSASQCDGSSVSLLQAMGCGLAVIVPEVGGNKEWVTQGGNGWLYPVGDTQALALATAQALENDAVRGEMGLANVKIIRERADWNRNFNKLLAAYDRLLCVRRTREVPAYAQLQNR